MEQASNNLVRICYHQFTREEIYRNTITRGKRDLAVTIQKYPRFTATVHPLLEDNNTRALKGTDSKQTNQDREASKPPLQSRDSKLKSI